VGKFSTYSRRTLTVQKQCGRCGGSFARRVANIDSHSFIYVCMCGLKRCHRRDPVVVVVAVRHAPNIPANEKRAPYKPGERESFNVIKNPPKSFGVAEKEKKVSLLGNVISTKQPGDIPIMALDVLLNTH